MAKPKIKDIVAECLQQFLPEKGLELYNVEYVKEGRDWSLKVYIDKPEGSEDPYICINECEEVSRYLSEKLDEIDPIEKNYYLEVSSPGLDRALLKDSDFNRFAGRLVEISFYKTTNGKKKCEGTLVGLEDGNIVIKDAKGQEQRIPQEAAAKTKLVVVF